MLGAAARNGEAHFHPQRHALPRDLRAAERRRACTTRTSVPDGRVGPPGVSTFGHHDFAHQFGKPETGVGPARRARVAFATRSTARLARFRSKRRNALAHGKDRPTARHDSTSGRWPAARIGPRAKRRAPTSRTGHRARVERILDIPAVAEPALVERTPQAGPRQVAPGAVAPRRQTAAQRVHPP
jgi:hypothetical protein